MSRVKKICLIILIFLLAVFLRFYNLGKQSFWVDELNHVYVAESLQKDGTFNLPSGEPYDRAKLFAYATVISTKLFGLNEVGLRIPSASFGVLSLLLVFLFAKRLFGFPVAVISLLLLTIIPFETGWSRISRFYTMFQFFTLLSWYFFYLGFEGLSNKDFINAGSKSKNSILGVFKNWNINWFYLTLFLICSVIAVSIQVIGGLFFLSILVYISLFSIYLFLTKGIKETIVSKYFILSFVGILILAVTISGIPQLREFVSYSLSYLPAWAKHAEPQDRLLYLKFILGKSLFPLGAFFFVGIWQGVLRLNKAIFFSAVVFWIPVFMFTIVFSYRGLHYLYNIFPFLVIIASYGIFNIINSERDYISGRLNVLRRLKLSSLKIQSRFVIISFFLIMSFSEFTKDGLAIPFGKGGDTNGAATFIEWREAFDYVKNNYDEQSIVVATVPLASYYYLGKVDFSLNLSGLDISKKQNLVDSSGNNLDFYSGAKFIKSISSLDSLVHSGKPGFVVADLYRLVSDLIVPEEIKEYIANNLNEVFVTPHETVFVYSWPAKLENNQESGL